MNQNNRLRLFPFAARPRFATISVAAILFAGVSTIALPAQQTTSGADSATDARFAAPLTLASNSPAAVDLTTVSGAGYSSSVTSANGPNSVEAERLNLADPNATQPPPRRRYGTPRYNDSSHNADGSNKYTFVLGVGLTAPVGNTYHYLNTSYGLILGGGRQFNKKFAVLLQFDYDHFGFNGRTLYNQSYLYDPTNSVGLLGQVDGSSHVWSFTLDPTYTFYSGDKLGAYAVVGGGFYHKTANFTTPEAEEECYIYCEEYEANATIDKYTSNAPGANGGFGLTLKPSKFASEKLFVEARYTFMANQYRPGLSVNNASHYGYPTNDTYSGANYYPANSNRTTYLTYKAGLRF